MNLYQMEKGHEISRQEPHKDWIVLSLGNSRVSDTKVMKNNGIVLSYVAKLCQKCPNEVYVWVADRISLRDFPEKCVEGGKWLNKNSNSKVRDMPKAIGLTKEELEKIKLKYGLKE